MFCFKFVNGTHVVNPMHSQQLRIKFFMTEQSIPMTEFHATTLPQRVLSYNIKLLFRLIDISCIQTTTR